jgi:alpha-tubulin suppressor-like RCC1 family protein
MSRHTTLSLALLLNLSAACIDPGYGIPIKVRDMGDVPDEGVVDAAPDVAEDVPDLEVAPDLPAEEMSSDMQEDLPVDADLPVEDMTEDMPQEMVLETLKDVVVVSFPLPDIKRVSIGGAHFCALTVGGQVFCWGDNMFGILGLGHTNQPAALEPVSGITNAVDISVSLNHACAVLADGRVSCWGSSENLWSDLQPRLTPEPLAGVTNIKEISGRLDHRCVIGDDRKPRCWGTNTYAQNFITAGATSPYREMSPFSNQAKKVISGYHGNCILEEPGYLRCAGILSESHPQYQLPNSPLGDRLTDVDYFSENICALLDSGAVKCWGLNSQGQSGAPQLTGVDFYEMPTVAQVPAAKMIAVGNSAVCAISIDDEVFCWGDPFTFANQGPGHVPRWVPLSKPSASVSLGGDFGCAIAQDKTMECWGEGLDRLPAIPGGVRRVVQ